MTGRAGLRRVVNSAEVLNMTSPCCICEFEQVVGGADDRPLVSDLAEAAHKELAEASSMFDLAEHGFDDLLSQTISAAPPGAFELFGHCGFARAFGPSPRTGGMRLAAARPAWSKIAGDPAAGELGEVF